MNLNERLTDSPNSERVCGVASLWLVYIFMDREKTKLQNIPDANRANVNIT